MRAHATFLLSIYDLSHFLPLLHRSSRAPTSSSINGRCCGPIEAADTVVQSIPLSVPVVFVSLSFIRLNMPSSQKMAAVGLLVSSYAVYVEYKMKTKSETEDFVALCDIEQISASCRYVELMKRQHRSDVASVVQFSHCRAPP